MCNDLRCAFRGQRVGLRHHGNRFGKHNRVWGITVSRLSASDLMIHQEIDLSLSIFDLGLGSALVQFEGADVSRGISCGSLF